MIKKQDIVFVISVCQQLFINLILFLFFFFSAAVLTPQQAAVAVINPFPPGPNK